MTPADFNARVAALGLTSKALPAARDVLVKGAKLRESANTHGVEASTLSRLCKRIREARFCPACGLEIPAE